MRGWQQGIRGEGDSHVTDGPFLDVKQVIGGFITLEADDIDEAVAIASEWPGLRRGACVSARPRRAIAAPPG
jgi:hypothetical protein